MTNNFVSKRITFLSFSSELTFEINLWFYIHFPNNPLNAFRNGLSQSIFYRSNCCVKRSLKTRTVSLMIIIAQKIKIRDFVTFILSRIALLCAPLFLFWNIGFFAHHPSDLLKHSCSSNSKINSYDYPPLVPDSANKAGVIISRSGDFWPTGKKGYRLVATREESFQDESNLIPSRFSCVRFMVCRCSCKFCISKQSSKLQKTPFGMSEIACLTFKSLEIVSIATCSVSWSSARACSRIPPIFSNV